MTMQDSGVAVSRYRDERDMGASLAACALSGAGIVVLLGIAALVEWLR